MSMKTKFYILLSLKTSDGFMNYGQFFLGNDWQSAYNLFQQIKGNEKLTDNPLLHIDLMETVDELPVMIKSKCCTLDELGINCKLIAREIFRLKNMEQMI